MEKADRLVDRLIDPRRDLPGHPRERNTATNFRVESSLKIVIQAILFSHLFRSRRGVRFAEGLTRNIREGGSERSCRKDKIGFVTRRDEFRPGFSVQRVDQRENRGKDSWSGKERERCDDPRRVLNEPGKPSNGLKWPVQSKRPMKLHKAARSMVLVKWLASFEPLYAQSSIGGKNPIAAYYSPAPWIGH